MNLKSLVPNLFTLSNLLCGVASVYFTSRNELSLAASLILAGALFDFFDGLIARLLHVDGELGKQLDSLADLISFGMAPAFIALHLSGCFSPNIQSVLSYVPILLVPFAAYRLAKFNTDTRQTMGFIGVPTPAIALFWLAFPLIFEYSDVESDMSRYYLYFSESQISVALAAIVCCALMVVEIPMLSLKFSSLKWKDNLFRYLLIICSVILLLLFQYQAIPIIIVLYVVLSLMKVLINR